MTHRERFLAALARGEPDRVPYAEFAVDRAFANRLLGRPTGASQRVDLETQPYTVEETHEIADALEMDNLPFVLRAPVFAEKNEGKDGRLFYGNGSIRGRADLSRVALPDPTDERLYEQARRFATRKRDRAACFVTRAGVFPVILSMGIDVFSIALYDDREFVDLMLARYFDWSIEVAKRVGAMGFDAYVTTDDMAYKTAPYFAPDLFREVILPHYRRLAEHVGLPWIIHSDGNIVPFLDDLVELGIAGLHPLENGAIDLRRLKKRYGGRICLLGNIDLNLLSRGSPAEVRREVARVLGILAPGGGYVCTSGNSLAAYLEPANVLAMVETVRRLGAYPFRMPKA